MPDAVDALVLGLEARDQRLEAGQVDRVAGKLDLDVPALAHVPHVRTAQPLALFVRTERALEARAHLRVEA